MINFKFKNKIRNNINSINNINNNITINDTYNSVIPLKIYQTWHSKDLPPIMSSCINELKYLNPEFEHIIYDYDDCRQFIQENYDERILNAYNKLIPQAFRSDLWRYCVLYKNGGIYLDVKFRCSKGFKLICLTEQEYFVRDLDKVGIYNALICCKPGNPIMLNCINNIVYNVETNYYGYRDLCVTGPHLLGKFFTQVQKNTLQIELNVINNLHIIKFNNRYILGMYNEYREEQNKYKKNELSYGQLWNLKKIYN